MNKVSLGKSLISFNLSTHYSKCDNVFTEKRAFAVQKFSTFFNKNGSFFFCVCVCVCVCVCFLWGEGEGVQ